LRAVIDTSVLISALISGDSLPGRIVGAWSQSAFTLICSEEQIAELRRVSKYARLMTRIRGSDLGALINLVRHDAVLLTKAARVDRSPDPFDNYLLGMAQTGSADYLVSGDKADLLALESHGQTRIVGVRAFAEIVKA
jgi:uncharacterized protein